MRKKHLSHSTLFFRHRWLAMCTLLCVGAFLMNNCTGSKKDTALDLPMSTTPIAYIGDQSIDAESFDRSYFSYLMMSGANDEQKSRQNHLEYLADVYRLSNYAKERQWHKSERWEQYWHSQQPHLLSDLYTQKLTIPLQQYMSDEEQRKHFARSKRKLYLKQLQFKNEQAAIRAQALLQQGVPFDSIAVAVYGPSYRQLSEAERIMGPISYLMDMDPNFAEAAWSLKKVGDRSELIPTREGWYLLELINEDRNPLITENEYQSQKEGFSQRILSRIYSARSDSLVRDMMKQLNVAPNIDAIKQTFELLQQLEEQPLLVASDEKFSYALPFKIKDSKNYQPDLVLVRYEFEGEEKIFTQSDYLRVLPAMSRKEALFRTMASVGRALKVHHFAQRAVESNLNKHPRFIFEKSYKERFFLAQMATDSIINSASDTQVHTMDSLSIALAKKLATEIQVSGWYANYESRQSALKALNTNTVKNRIEFQDQALEKLPPFVAQLTSRKNLDEAVIVVNNSNDFDSESPTWTIVQILAINEVSPTSDKIEMPLLLKIQQAQRAGIKLEELREEWPLRVETQRMQQLYELNSLD